MANCKPGVQGLTCLLMKAWRRKKWWFELSKEDKIDWDNWAADGNGRERGNWRDKEDFRVIYECSSVFPSPV